MSSFQDKVTSFIDSVPEQQGSNWVQYGKIHCEMNVLKFHGKGNPPTKTPITRKMIEKGLQVPANEQIQLTVNVDVREFNPALEREWFSNVKVVKSNKDNKDSARWLLTDWSETVFPSLQAIFGDEWIAIALGEKEVYGAVESFPSQYVKEGKKDYGTAKFIAQYKDADECKEARNARYGNQNGSGESDEVLGIPEDVIAQARSLLKSLKGKVEKLRPMLDLEPFNTYDPDAILAELSE